jgi:hypothetical protein
LRLRRQIYRLILSVGSPMLASKRGSEPGLSLI